LLNLQFKTLSDLLGYINLVLWQHVVLYVCELYGVQLGPAVDMRVVPYSMRLVASFSLYGTTRISTAGLN